jgi:hypothetical protein
MNFSEILILDAETRWAKNACSWAPDGYTLSKMTTEEYVRDNKFKAFGFGYKFIGKNERGWVTHNDLPKFFAGVDWGKTAVAHHNAQFDASILAWHYDVIPAFIFDTLSMARAVRGPDAGNSAFKLAQDLGLPPKGHTTADTDGLWELTPYVEEALADYCMHDVWLCEQFLNYFSKGYPKKELRLIDATIRMFTQPQLYLDAEMLRGALEEEKTARESLLKRLNAKEEDLASDGKFAELLTAVGVEPPTKKSKTTGKTAFAFAKNDAMFQALLNHDNEEVALLCEARVKVKSTQMRTRAQRFSDIASRGALPVPVTYAGARTLRWTAAKGASINMQNLKRGSVLRRAIMAPPGHVVVAGDLSQIEPRVIAFLAEHRTLLDIFASGADPYAVFGSTMFGIPGMTKESHKDLRQSAKSALLGANYRLGFASFSTQLLTGFLGAPPVRYDKKFAKQLGINETHLMKFMEGKAGAERMQRMSEIPHTCTDEELFIHCVCAKEIIDRYRAASEPIVKFWNFLDKMVATVLAVDDAEPVTYKCLVFKPGKILLPNGLHILYEKIECELDGIGRPQYSYWNGKKRKPLHSGIVAENVTSGTARCVISDGMDRIQSRYRVAMPVHDEAVYVVKQEEKEEAVAWIKEQLTKEPPYLPGIPLDASVGAHERYGLAKD